MPQITLTANQWNFPACLTRSIIAAPLLPSSLARLPSAASTGFYALLHCPRIPQQQRSYIEQLNLVRWLADWCLGGAVASRLLQSYFIYWQLSLRRIGYLVAVSKSLPWPRCCRSKIKASTNYIA